MEGSVFLAQKGIPFVLRLKKRVWTQFYFKAHFLREATRQAIYESCTYFSFSVENALSRARPLPIVRKSVSPSPSLF